MTNFIGLPGQAIRRVASGIAPLFLAGRKIYGGELGGEQTLPIIGVEE
jgi:hypothetical protein